MNASVHFQDNLNGYNKAVVILAGYKQQLWKKTFQRLKSYIPNDYDVMIVSSGRELEELAVIAKENHWAYLPLKKNNVCVALNTAIQKLSNAETIVKIDEDIFVTQNSIKSIEDELESPSINVKPGFVAPLIPINGFAHTEVLNIFEKEDLYNSKFGLDICAAGPDQKIENDVAVAKFFWNNEVFGNVDEMNQKVKNYSLNAVTCPIRFSIGMIAFKRSTWDKMGFFKSTGRGADMGQDEVQIDTFCVLNSMPMVVDRKSLVGHLSFGKQNESMLQFFEENPELF
ncbi:hypothetical protein [Pediococcus argentinicus]|uniref:Glycosyltransferase 2-like domain-containing protein n=2 Tax=Pediococcus argentinicus TaxID=480391 RepID=A0A0R2N7Y0_9LACO|nr:hypothetical protein [Pediococcus argentinicus]KRO21953.1 hypothetical protein IV88_GL001325 [Pediococcus argentinicus]GEP20247.1 hypothetical protein LSA03_16310 [Pediococcus argentinicus]